ncbi:TonB-dependent receptor [Novosphingobium sp. Leaf2]|uniref:TonB-dependent receptor n=1 Tax=Novosphingobium sp. Leaf2 TaxID=1735670 RepID=UPI000B01B710|nr:TonB-dependent receptor [Novosphingobium sp. Leaf2]
MRVFPLWACALPALAFTSQTAFAQDATAQAEPGSVQPAAPAADASPSTIVVTAKRLDDARASIQPSLGATSYTITNATIQALPGGDNQQFNQIVLQLPGVVQDGFGQFHVRDDHNNLQYRINGTILPEGLAVFGQTLSPRLINSFNLLTGALPAQYGLRTAGIIDVTTKSGFDNAGAVSLYGGSHGMIEPSVQYGGSTGSTNYFVSADYRYDKLGIESVDGTSTPIHDGTKQLQLFAYVDHILDDENRVSFVGGYANQLFQIPDPSGLQAADTNPGWNVNGQTDYLSNNLNERQLERTGFGQIAFLHDSGPLTIQTSLFARYSLLRYTPDTLGELLFNGQAQNATKKDVTAGAQIDGAYRLSSAHTLRFGALFEHDHGSSQTATAVFPGSYDDTGNFIQTGQPITIVDNGAKTETTESVYLQDEWKLLPTLTFNFGARFDHYDGYRSEQQLSPRANLVWQPTPGTTIHAGYARYFSPAPFENVATTTISKFAGTSAAPPSGALDTTPFAERQNYFDVGFQHAFGTSGVTFGLDGYYRRSHQLIDEGQFGAPIILTPFNYRRGRIHGIEGNVSYTKGPWLAYANFAYAKAQGKDITSSQFDFDPADLAYIQTHYIYLDHDQTYTGSGGISYAFKQGPLAGLQLGGSMIYGSGLRADGAVPNGVALKDYAQFNLSSSYKIAGPGIQVRFDIINVGNLKYEIRDGTGVGVGAPQYGPRRGFFVGISKDI